MKLRSVLGVYAAAFVLAAVASCSKQSVVKSVGVGPTPASVQELSPLDGETISGTTSFPSPAP